MAYTITQQATSPNAAYTRLLYVVSGSTNTANPQFQYMMDVYESGSSSRIKRTFSTVNPAGVSVFDPSRIIQGELSQDNSWKISSVTPFQSSSKTFTLKFGETYATSISSSASIVEDIQQTDIEVFRGVVEPNAGYFNWDSGSYAVLSNMPATMSMQPDDYGTISLYNNSVQFVSQSFYSASSTADISYQLVEQKNYSVTDTFSSVPISSSANWNYVDVSISSSIGLQNYRYEVSNKTHNEKVRFAFINKLGSWDFYNNFNPVRQAIQVEREQYTAPRVDYSSLTSTYDISRRGRNDYHNSTDDVFTVDTDLLNQVDANWLEELIESPSVYIERNNEFIPIVITDSSYTANTNQARQKQFQYTINFKPSNQPYGTWIPEYVSCPKQPIPVTGSLPILGPDWYYNSQEILVLGAWDDTLAVGRNFPGNNTPETGFTRINYFTSQSRGPYTGNWWNVDPNFNTSNELQPNLPWINGNNGSAAGLTGSNYTLQSWVYINEFSEIDSSTPRSVFFTLTGDQGPYGAGKVHRVSIGSRQSGSVNVLSISGDVDSPDPSLTQLFPNKVITTGSWYQISLVQDGTNFNDLKVYVDSETTSYSPTASADMRISGSYTYGAGTFTNTSALSGSIANVICYSTSSLTQAQVAQNYQNINNYLTNL